MRLVRRTPRTADEVQWDPTTRTLDPRALDGVDGVVHLAGVGVGDKRWTPPTSTRSSPRGSTARTRWPTAVAAADHPVRLVSASAVGFYGDRGDEELTEASTPGTDFLSDVVQAWEAAAQPAVDAGASVVLPAHRHRDGARGRRDEADAAAGAVRGRGPAGLGAAVHALDHACPTRSARSCTCSTTPTSPGRSTSTAAQPARQKEIAKALGRALHRPAVLPAPSFALRAAIGGFASEVLGGQRIIGDRLRESGYQLIHGDLDTAIRWLVA